MRVEAVPVVRLRERIPRPVRRLVVLEDDARVLVLRRRVAPHVEVALGRAGRGAARALEPRVLARGVVEHELGDHPQPAAVGLLEQPGEVLARAVVLVDVRVVGDVVAAVPERRWVERQQPDRGDAEVGQVVEARDETVDVADAVVRRVLVRADVDLVDDRVLEPQRVIDEEILFTTHRKYSKSFSVRTNRRTSNTCAGCSGASSTKLWAPRQVYRPPPNRSWTWYASSGDSPSSVRSSVIQPRWVWCGSRLTTHSITSSPRRF